MSADRSGSLVAAGFFHLFGSQLLTRLLTFTLNLATARSLSPAAYGLGAVQFHLINSTILFLSREGFRRGCLRVDPSDPKSTRKVLGAALLTVPIGTVLSTLVIAFVLLTSSQADPLYRQAVAMQGAAALLELLAEPLYILATVRLWFGARVGCEAAATVVRHALTLLLLWRGSPPALALSWGQLAYGGATLGGFTLIFILKDDAAALLRDFWSAERDPSVLRICGAFSVQACGKLVLAEGSKGVLAAATPLEEQGVYGLVNNLGSLVVRTVFQPFEEAAFVAFSQPPSSEAKSATLNQRAALLSTLFRITTFLGCLSAAFGPAYAHLALATLYGSRWAESGAAGALAVYSWYVVLMAANGILEAFVHAVADPKGLHRANVALAALSAAHVALSLGAVNTAGAAGLLVADGLNMALRIGYCLWFVSSFFGGLHALKFLPAQRTRAALGAALVLTLISQAVLMPEASHAAAFVPQGWAKLSAPLSPAVRALLHGGVGAACLAGVGAVAYSSERDLVATARSMKGKKEA